MITQADIRAKPDDELLDIWAKQHEYIEEMILWVKAEIDRRHLDVSHIHVPTEDETKAEEEEEADRDFVRMVTWGQGVTGLLLLLSSLLVVVDGLMTARLQKEAWDFSLGLPLGLFAFGALLTVYAVGVWREKKWAILSGMVVYSIITLVNVAVTILVMYASIGGGEIRPPFLALPLSLGCTVVSGSLVLAFRRLHKKRLKVLGEASRYSGDGALD